MIEPRTGLYVEMREVAGQDLRIGIRPPPPEQENPARPPLLLFNGIGSNIELGGPFLRALDDCAAITFDVPGVGHSPVPLFPYRMAWLAWLARKVLDELGYDKVDVLGASWGGALAQQFAMQYPGRVRRLVLAATGMGAGAMVPGPLQAFVELLDARRLLEPDYVVQVAPMVYGGRFRTDPAAIHQFLALAGAYNWRGFRYQLLAVLGWSSLPWLWRMRMPTLIMAGSDDPLVPEVNAKWQAKLMPRARVHLLDDGHLFLLSSARESAEAVAQFLDA
jgi:poly(3-hydroxyalkanoate) depolymerase